MGDPSVLESEDLKPNHSWARLIQKIYDIDLLTCSKCQGKMKVISWGIGLSICHIPFVFHSPKNDGLKIIPSYFPAR
jgi:hypothetical protein